MLLYLSVVRIEATQEYKVRGFVEASIRSPVVGEMTSPSLLRVFDSVRVDTVLLWTGYK